MIKSFFASLIVVCSLTASHAQAADSYDLKKLDVFGSCKAGTVKEENAELSLSFLKAFVTWHIGDQMMVVHPDFIAWHSSLAGLLEAMPAFRGKVPFDMGQYYKSTYVQTMAFLAYHNDIENYVVAPTRVDCVGDDKVILMTNFTGVQLKRDDTTGCVTHTAPFGSPTKIAIQFKEGQRAAGEPVQKLVYRVDSYLDDSASVKVREELARRVKTEPALKPEPSTCKTRQMILDEFNAQVVP